MDVEQLHSSSVGDTVDLKSNSRRIMDEMKRKYDTDVSYKQLVDMMTHQIASHRYSPSEMREAAVLASINYEMMREPRPIYFDIETEQAFKILRDRG